MIWLWRAFLNSWSGLRSAAASERGVRLELGLLAVGVPLALILGAHLWVSVALIASLALMLAAELLNTAIEALCDHLTPVRHPKIGLVKDLASAGAFVTQGIAAMVWVCAVVDRIW